MVKALCLGATAIGLGRPFIYAASGWGSDGIEKALMSMFFSLQFLINHVAGAISRNGAAKADGGYQDELMS